MKLPIRAAFAGVAASQSSWSRSAWNWRSCTRLALSSKRLQQDRFKAAHLQWNHSSAHAFRDAVQQYEEAPETPVGGQALQDSLRKLITLSKKFPSHPPGGPPNGFETACKMLGLMQGMVGIPLMLLNMY
ncbi:hypothetical protein B0T10DRAFT_467922 [Thelonectria olida]|uniref:Uncharacterized protein n=1 Tax=Thelonectria olida TaxID=1576542 RepID=A0A9P8VP92_9HYPO|nr:hypothetical protein B0T10DRAFT_467922 [Thelonectria olida]